MAERRRISIAILAGAMCVPAVRAAASAVLVMPAGAPLIQTGIGLPQWTKLTADLQAATGGQIVQSTAALNDIATLESYNGIWVDIGAADGALTATQSANLQAYLQTGRRAVLIGESSDWASWDSSILGAVGGSYAGGNFDGTTSTRSFVALTTGVASFNAVTAGVAKTGTSLFQDRVATVWGPAQNAVVLLDTTSLSNTFLSAAGNATFATNLTNWVAGGLAATTNWKLQLGGNWTTTTGWSGAQMPSVADTAVFNLGRNGTADSSYTVVLPGTKVLAGLNVLADKVTLGLSAGPALGVNGAISIAPPANQIGQLSLTRTSGLEPAVVSAGTITLGGGVGSSPMLNIGTGVTLKAQSVSLGSGASLVQSGGSLHVDGSIEGAGSLVQSAGDTSAASLQVGAVSLNGGTLTMLPRASHDAASSVSVLNSLTITQSFATFDLANNDLVIQNGDLATITSDLASGYDGGKWVGPGIDSSYAAGDSTHRTALGVLQNTDGNGHRLYGIDAPLGLFDGQDPAYGAILIKYTYYGDNDLSGVVDAADVARDRPGAGGWSTGDFNYDGNVDALDLSVQAGAIIDGGTDSDGSPSVPEPLIGPLMFAGLAVQSLRRLRP